MTEKEIYEGIFDKIDDPNENIQDRALVFIRNLVKPDLADPQNVTKDRLVPLRRYFELEDRTNSISEAKVMQIVKLKDKLRAKFSICRDNLSEYNKVVFPLADFQVEDNRIKDDNVFQRPNRVYFKKFEDDFMSKMTMLIDREQKRPDKFMDLKNSDDAAFLSEVILHSSFCKHLSERVMFRADCLEKVRFFTFNLEKSLNDRNCLLEFRSRSICLLLRKLVLL